MKVFARISGLSLLAAVTAGLVGIGVPTHSLANDGLKEILDRGVLRVGIRADKKPFGYRAPSGELIGFDADLAKDMAARLNVKLELIAVTGGNRMQFLQQGKIDVMSANMNDSFERRKQVGVVFPNGIAVGLNVMSHRADGFKTWESLKGHTACIAEGAWAIRYLDEKYGIKPISFKGSAEAFTAFEQGRCRVRIGNDQEIFFKLEDEPQRYKDQEMALETIGFSPYAVAVPLDQQEKALGMFMSGVLYAWHREGKFIDLWAKAGFPKSPWLEEQKGKAADWITPDGPGAE